jgi:hypothetical protein
MDLNGKVGFGRDRGGREEWGIGVQADFLTKYTDIL